MADDVIQRLGFDAGQAIKTINELKDSLDSLNRTLVNTGRSLSGWNKGARGATTTLKSIQKGVDTLLGRYKALAKAQAGVQTAAPAPEADAKTQLGLVSQLSRSTFGGLGGADAALKQAYGQAAAAAASFAAKNQMTSQQVTHAWANMGKTGNGVMGQLQARFGQLAAAHASAASSIKTGNQSIEFSFSSMLKILQFRVAISAITALAAAFREGITAAADFSRSLGQIQTIARGLDKTPMGEISASLKNISALYGKDLADVTSGYYTALQAQVGDAAQTMNVMEQANKLAVATGSTLNDSVQTLTVALNGFNLRADQAGDAAGKLFKTMELGRFQFANMKDAIGRVNSLATQLGVSLEEVLGPISTMTQKGVRFEIAVTQWRAVIMQLLKPTRELKAAFESWGVDDAQQAMQKFGGLIPMLRQLEAEFNNNAAATGKAFTNIRALTGIMSALGDSYGETAKNADEIGKATQDVIDTAAGLVAETEGQQFYKTINEIKLAFIGLGEDVLPVLNLTLSGVKALANGIAAFGAPGVLAGLGAAAGAIAHFTLAARIATISLAGLKAAMLALWPIALAIGAAWASWKIGEKIGEWLLYVNGVDVSYHKVHQKLLKSEAEFTEFVLKEAKRRAEGRQKEHKEWETSAASAMTELKKINKIYTEDALANNKNVVKTLETQLNGMIKTQENIVSNIGKTAEGGNKEILNAREAYNDGARKLADKEFSYYTENLNSRAKSWQESNRAEMRMREAMAQLTRAQTPEDFEKVKKLLSEAESFASQAASTAGTEKANRAAVWKARQIDYKIARAGLQVDKQRADLVAKEVQKSSASQKAEIDKLDKMKGLVAEIVKGYTLDDGKGGTKKESAVIRDAEAAEVAWGKLLKLVETGDIDASQLLGVADLKRELQIMSGKLPDLRAKVRLDFEEDLGKLTAVFESLPNIIKFDFPGLDKLAPLADLLDRLAKDRAKLDELAGPVENLQAKFRVLGDSIDSRVLQPLKNVEATKNTPTELSKAWQQLIISYKKLGEINPEENLDLFRQATSNATKEFMNFQTLFDAGGVLGAESFFIDPTTFTAIREGLKVIRQDLASVTGDDVGFKAKIDYDEIKTRVGGLTEFFNQEFKLNVALPENFSAEWGAAAQKAADADTSAGNLKRHLQDSQTFARGLAGYLNEAATASSMIQMPKAQTQAMGGLMRLAAGGSVFKSHGTDTIPAMLSRGEFVVNAGATRRFYSQLVAMNAGAKPIYRQDGGSVTNVGDINVSVNGGASNRQTAREIATALRREVRRGTSKL